MNKKKVMRGSLILLAMYFIPSLIGLMFGTSVPLVIGLLIIGFAAFVGLAGYAVVLIVEGLYD